MGFFSRLRDLTLIPCGARLSVCRSLWQTPLCMLIRNRREMPSIRRSYSSSSLAFPHFIVYVCRRRRAAGFALPLVVRPHVPQSPIPKGRGIWVRTTVAAHRAHKWSNSAWRFGREGGTSYGSAATDVGWGESRLFWMKGEWTVGERGFWL